MIDKQDLDAVEDHQRASEEQHDAASPRATWREHEGWCEAELGHPLDCGTATRLARLQAIAEAVVHEIECPIRGGCAGIDPCLHCAAIAALEVPRG